MSDPLKSLARWVLPLGFALSLLPGISSAAALTLGLALALSCGNPYLAHTRKLVRPLLAYSIIGLGAGMNLMVIARAGLAGVGFTIVGLAVTLLIGRLLGRLLKTPLTLGLLINVGTAICGGSAIAAASTAVQADEEDTSLALAVIFILNACGLLIFPMIGHAFNLSETQFGLWAATSIHDTSSVVGATMQYGAQALETGTTVKLVRSLWIIPVTLLVSYLHRRKQQLDPSAPKPQYPRFILGFLLMSALVTWIPALRDAGHTIEFLAKRALTATLFLIGCGLTLTTLRKVGLRPLLHGVILWILVAAGNLLVILG